MKIFAESFDLGSGAVIFIIGWIAIALITALTVNNILTLIGVKIAQRKNKNKSILSAQSFSIKPYLMTSSIFLVIALSSFVADVALFFLPLLTVISPLVGYYSSLSK